MPEPTIWSSTDDAGPLPRVGSLHLGAINLAQVSALRPSFADTAQVTTLTVSAPTSGQTYTFTVTPPKVAAQTVSAAATSTTPADLIALFLATIRSNSYITGAFSVTSTSTTIVFTARTPGTAGDGVFTEVADPTNDLSFSESTDEADAGTATYGRYYPVSRDTSRGGEATYAQPSTLAGPVLTLTQTHDASGAYSLDLTVSDPLGRVTSYVLSWTQGGSAAATDDALEAELAAELGASGTLITIANPSTGVVTATFPVGYRVGFADATATGGSAALVPTVTTGSAAPTPALILGDGEGSDTVGSVRTASRAGSNPVGLLRGNGTLVTVEDPGAAVTAGEPVWIDSTTGAPKASAAPGRYMHPCDVWVARNLSDLWGGTVALVEAR